ncbi:MAG TPA: hypothetical protein VFP72_20965 [Kineosporiaceae bacterium]|nr:hypothetical protein [Kineosporiaceae bacterium]
MSGTWERLAAALSDPELDLWAGGTGRVPGDQVPGDTGPPADGGSGPRRGPGPPPGLGLAEELARLMEALTVGLTRHLRPEVVEHLVAAAAELAVAIRLGLADPDPGSARPGSAPESPPGAAAGARPGEDGPARPPSRSGVPIEHIDVTD